MEDTLLTALEFLATYGYVVVFAWMFADQAALPIPAIPLLVAAGALSFTGELELSGVILAATAATVLADSLWFALGRYKGATAISLVCRLSIEPDTCVSTTRNAFGKFGPVTLIIAKYLPGVQTLAPASAGFVRAPWLGFLALDLMGTLLFVLPFILGGYYLQPQLAQFMTALSEISGGIALFVGVVLGIYLAVKLTHWLVFLRGHRLRRLTVEELNVRLEQEDPLTVVDLRQRLDFEALPEAIPGALRIPISEIKARREEVPSRYDVVLVCT